MRAALALLFVAVLAVVGWLVFGNGDDDPSLPSVPQPSQPAPAEQPNLANGASPDRTDQTPVTQPTTKPVEPETSPQPAPAAPGNVVLAVRDVSSRESVAAFRWRFRSGTADEKGDGTGGRAEILLPTGNAGTLLVEAEGYEPLSRADFTPPAPPSPATTLDLFLVPAARDAGITLHVHDVALQPIPNLRVDAFALTPQNRDGAWWLTPTLWARRNSSANGAYQLPALAPGEYGIRCVAVDEAGELLPLLPFQRTYSLSGTNGFLEDVPLEPGALFALELLDSNNQPYDPAKFGTATLALRFPGGPTVQRKWIVRHEQAEAGAIDVLPGIGVATLAEAIPGGQYQLEVFVNGDPRVQKQLLLRPGTKNVERVLVP